MSEQENKHELINRELVIKAVGKKAEKELGKLANVIHLDGYNLLDWVGQAITEYNEEAR